MKSVLLASRLSADFQHFLEGKGYVLVEEAGETVEGIVTSNRLRLDRTAIDSFPQLKWIARLGSGMEIIDREYCNEKNIACFSSPKGISNAVAEHATGMLLNLFHAIGKSHQEIQSGFWIREENRGLELETCCVGIIGYGHTGSALAKKLRAFTENILAYDQYKQGFGNDQVKEVSLEELMQRADIISFHVPLNEETRYYYNEAFLHRMAKPHVLINTSRGEVCSTQTILKGLQEGKITGACLDVLEEEKNINHVLSAEGNTIEKLLHYNTVLTPHIAGYTHQAIEKMCAELQAQLEKWMKTSAGEIVL